MVKYQFHHILMCDTWLGLFHLISYGWRGVTAKKLGLEGGRCQEKNKTKKQYRGGGLVELKKMLMDENQVRK